MTDRQLLELAAKAAGIELTPHPNAKIARNLVFTAWGKNWNPPHRRRRCAAVGGDVEDGD